MRRPFIAGVSLIALGGRVFAADVNLPTKAPPAPAYDFVGFYIGGHLGYAAGSSAWTASAAGVPFASGSLDFFQPFDAFSGAGSYFSGGQVGYNLMLPNRFLLGGEADVSFPAFPFLSEAPSFSGISIGGASTLVSPVAGAERYSENMVTFGSVRGRIGHALGNWLFYATGGFAWAYDRAELEQLSTGITGSQFQWRFGWTAGAGVEAAIDKHWSARLEYLYSSYGRSAATFGDLGQRFDSDLTLQQLRAGLDYRFGSDAEVPNAPPEQASTAGDVVNFHTQATFTWQGYPAIRSPYEGPNSLPGSGQGRESFDATLFAGVRLWQGAQFWIEPEIDQGFGIGDVHGVAGFTSDEAPKIGSAYPYTRVPKYFMRQTIDLGGQTQKVDADLGQFAGSQTANRLVLTLGKFAVTDIFDTNKYANSSKSDFLNQSLINAGTFDYAADAWGYTYGAAAEWYQGDWTWRGGFFDLSRTPTGGIAAEGVNLDPTFGQFQVVGEIERRYQLGGQPGAVKITAFVNNGRAATFSDVLALAQEPGPFFGDANAALSAARTYDSRPGVSINLQQQIADDMGVFARAGWADGNIEPWDFTDIDGTVSGGVSITGKRWNRPDDTVGIGGAVNAISGVHEAFLNAGGLGIVVGDGMLPHPGLEQIIETYYSYALNSSTHVTFDYQFVNNPGYNTDRGPVNVFSSRLHWQF
jgi:high affinity Mn2+ porin